MLHLEAVEPGTLALLRRIQALPFMSRTRLVGGTALALQLGHRISVDLDFFGEWTPLAELESVLSECGRLRVKTAGENKLQFFELDGVKVDCVTYSDFPWIDDSVIEGGVVLAGLGDIAAMKINAITNRGTRKDFIDVCFLLERFSLSEILTFFRKKYPKSFLMLALRSLLYFDDAEAEPMPRMLMPFDWEAAKAKITQEVRKILNDPLSFDLKRITGLP